MLARRDIATEEDTTERECGRRLEVVLPHVLRTELDINILPTSRPDVYLLVGQSNMVGFSEDG